MIPPSAGNPNHKPHSAPHVSLDLTGSEAAVARLLGLSRARVEADRWIAFRSHFVHVPVGWVPPGFPRIPGCVSNLDGCVIWGFRSRGHDRVIAASACPCEERSALARTIAVRRGSRATSSGPGPGRSAAQSPAQAERSGSSEDSAELAARTGPDSVTASHRPRSTRTIPVDQPGRDTEGVPPPEWIPARAAA